uniref:Uncharacterized protein n=1 Tax=Peronospora matthiolae TaxID=2874970 RepID=A0AAV1T3R0_9STRA
MSSRSGLSSTLGHIDELCQQKPNLHLLLRDQQMPVMMNDKSGVEPVDGGRDGVYHDPLDVHRKAGSTDLCRVGDHIEASVLSLHEDTECVREVDLMPLLVHSTRLLARLLNRFGTTGAR